MSKFRIAYICDSNFKLDSRPQKEVSTLLKKGYEVIILDWDRTKEGAVEQEVYQVDGLPITINNVCIKGENGGTLKSMALIMLKYEWTLIKWLISKRKNYDLIYACNFNTAFFSWKLSRIFKKKFVYDIFDYYVDSHSYTREGSRFRIVIEKADAKIINSADAVIICSEKRKEQIKNTSPKLLEVIHNSPESIVVGAENRLNKYKFSVNKVKIAYVGYIEPGRPVKWLADIVAADNRMEFHCAGYGPDADLISNLAKKVKNVFFYGQVSYEEAINIEKNCDLIPALYNPTLKNHMYAAPNKFYEALMLGKPTLMIHNTGMDELVEKYELGGVCECNITSIKDALDNLIQNKDKWGEMGARGNQLYKERYSWSVMEKKLIYTIDKILRDSQ